ncbi:MAG TPA: RHS repeat-associated core domain-containing protein [Thermoanaerobaculia bacterium]|nr:RHS repeat-associated core domain-containing protein [Thermoanaerobaculia bacterium]
MKRLFALLLLSLVATLARGQEVTPGGEPVIGTPEQRSSSAKSTFSTPQTDTATNPWTSGDYVYDGSGNIKAIGTTIRPNDAGLKDTFAYDAVGRLTSATTRRAEGTANESSTYDAFGNQTSRTTQRFTGAPVTTNVPVIAASNRIQGAQYDAAGNLTSYSGNYMYDAVSMMLTKVGAAGGDELYIYTAGDERIAVKKQGDLSTWSWTWTPRDLDGKVLRTYETWTDPTGGTWRWIEDHIYANGRLIGAEREAAEGGARHFHLDHLGTPRLITNDSGLLLAEHDYLPFGVELTPLRQEVARGYAHEEPMKFTGHERDFTGGTAVENTNYLDYMHARYYSPGLGRFLSVDPARESMDSRIPQSWNRYAYVLDNPINDTDPDGRMFGGMINAARGLMATDQYLREQAKLPAKADIPPALLWAVLRNFGSRSTAMGPNPRMGPRGESEIRGSEGFYSNLYLDVAGHCTIGYGHLVNRGACGAPAQEQFGNGISKAEGLRIFSADAARVVNPGLDKVTATLSQGQTDAVGSLVFNIGAGAFGKSGTLRALNDGDFATATARWLGFNKAGGVYTRGLFNRRVRELQMFWGE